MNSAEKIQYMYNNGHVHLALQLVDTLNYYQCIKYLFKCGYAKWQIQYYVSEEIDFLRKVVKEQIEDQSHLKADIGIMRTYFK